MDARPILDPHYSEPVDQDFEDFRLNYTGNGDVKVAYRAHLAGQEAEAAEAAREKQAAARPSKAALAFTRGVLSDAAANVKRFRNAPPTAEERTDLIDSVMKAAESCSAVLKAELKAEVVRIVDGFVETGNGNTADEAARSGAFRIAGTLPRTFQPPTTDDDPVDISSIPRA
jgi:hypothetical protein